ncbi:DUF721 domain-containing protein [Schaalia naturae]|uniref:DUF721 domain-containing protein n=2 Tax=Schaalia naturae TaxID=635203 RepID=A0ABW2SNP7_9ACTO
MRAENDGKPSGNREEDPAGAAGRAGTASSAGEGPTEADLRAVADAALQRMREARLGVPRASGWASRRAARGAVGARLSRMAARWTRAPGMAAARTQWEEPAPLGAVIGHVSRQRGWEGPAAMGSVMARWPVIVGTNLSEHCRVETFEDHRLIVRCSSTAWAKQLQLLLPHIERRIDEEVGPGVVTQVVVRGPAAPSWRRGRYSVPGRGPRDTYG